MDNPLHKIMKNGIYAVQPSGMIFNTIKKYYIGQTLFRGRLTVSLNINGKILRKNVHRIVAQMWSPNPDKFKHVIFLDGNVCNVHSRNLRWVNSDIHRKHRKNVEYHRKMYNPCITTYRDKIDGYEVPDKYKKIIHQNRPRHSQ